MPSVDGGMIDTLDTFRIDNTHVSHTCDFCPAEATVGIRQRADEPVAACDECADRIRDEVANREFGDG